MESQPNDLQNEEDPFDAVETLALCGLVPLVWLLIAICAWTTYSG